MGKKSKYFWHVPPGAWATLDPTVNGVDSVAGDVVILLVDAESGVASAHPEIDNFVVERIVGQYMIKMHAVTPPPVGMGIAHRVYVTDADTTSVAFRNLNTADDAETSFLWHQVDAMAEDLNNDPFGSWQRPSSGARPRLTPTPTMGRYGHIDIRVGRRLEGGEALVWHSQSIPAQIDDSWSIKLWLRFLVREG